MSTQPSNNRLFGNRALLSFEIAEIDAVDAGIHEFRQ